MNEPTAEQIEAWQTLWSTTFEHNPGIAAAIVELKNFLPDALTNPRPVLPEEQGEYRSASGHLWWLDDGGWHNTRGSWPDSNARKYAPFTRLVPERPEPTSKEIRESWGISREDDKSIPREPDGSMLAVHAYSAGYKAGAKR